MIIIVLLILGLLDSILSNNEGNDSLLSGYSTIIFNLSVCNLSSTNIPADIFLIVLVLLVIKVIL